MPADIRVNKFRYISLNTTLVCTKRWFIKFNYVRRTTFGVFTCSKQADDDLSQKISQYIILRPLKSGFLSFSFVISLVYNEILVFIIVTAIKTIDDKNMYYSQHTFRLIFVQQSCRCSLNFKRINYNFKL